MGAKPNGRRTGKKVQAPISHSEVERIKNRIQQDKEYLASFSRVENGEDPEAYLSPAQAREVDVEAIRTRIKRNERALHSLAPEFRKLTGIARQKAYKEIKEHEEWLKKRMLSTWEMGAYPSATDPEKDHLYRQAVEKSVKQEVGSAEYQQRAHRMKELARLLDPEDPELANLERLRPRRRY